MISNTDPMAAVLGQMQGLAAQAAGGAAPAAAGTGAAQGGDFASMLQGALGKVSGEQTQAVSEAQAFELGQPNVALNDVMVDLQKSNIDFQEAVQVRNKLVSAYNDIMQMSV